MVLDKFEIRPMVPMLGLCIAGSRHIRTSSDEFIHIRDSEQVGTMHDVAGDTNLHSIVSDQTLHQ